MVDDGGFVTTLLPKNSLDKCRSKIRIGNKK
jgi:hypothetical protein